MIQPPPQRERCNFEEYCRHYCPASQGHDPCKGTVKGVKCEHDTRSRPHTPAPERNELAEQECAINNCMRRDWMDRHDAAIARAATLAVLTDIEDKISAYEKEHAHDQVCDERGMYIPVRIVRRLITVRKPKESLRITGDGKP